MGTQEIARNHHLKSVPGKIPYDLRNKKLGTGTEFTTKYYPST